MANIALQDAATGTYTSYSGADAVASFNGVIIANMQSVTISTNREKGPVFVMGSPDPVSFTRGKRGIAGTLVFVTFDRDALINEVLGAIDKDMVPGFTAAGNIAAYTSIRNNVPEFNKIYSIDDFARTNQQAANAQKDFVGNPFVQLEYNYADQLPPLDITLTFANEYGAASYMTIYKMEILNNGTGISIDDLQINQAYTYVARGMYRMRPGFKTSAKGRIGNVIEVHGAKQPSGIDMLNNLAHSRLPLTSPQSSQFSANSLG